MKFREQLQEAYVTSETDGCLALWSPSEFEKRAQQMKELMLGSAEDRMVARVFFAGAQEANPDRQGRVALPQHLRDFAHLEREVVINGAFDHVEIWDAAEWRQRKHMGEQALAGSGFAR